jgi:hypothetical protein
MLTAPDGDTDDSFISVGTSNVAVTQSCIGAYTKPTDSDFNRHCRFITLFLFT